MSETNETKDDGFDGWAVLELMGHRKLAGLVSEATIAGKGFIRLDVYLTGAEKPAATQYYSPSSVYALTPTTEEMARGFAARNVPQPIARYELPQLTAAHGDVADAEMVDDEGYEP